MVFFHLEKAGVNLSDGWNANGNERHKPHVVATLAIDENAFCDGEKWPARDMWRKQGSGRRGDNNRQAHT